MKNITTYGKECGRKLLLGLALCVGGTVWAAAQETLNSPDGKLQVKIDCDGTAGYTVLYNGKTLLQKSPLGLKTNIGDFTQGLKMTADAATDGEVDYTLTRIKTAHVKHAVRKGLYHFDNGKKGRMDVEFVVSNNDVAFRYLLPKQNGRASVVIEEEKTGFTFPDGTTTFITPQSDPMIGWKRSKPSYEEHYKADAPLNAASQYGHGYTFPCLFRVAGDGWVLVSETGVDSRYCASHLSDVKDNTYTIAFPMPGENNGNGTTAPGLALPGATPWRTLTVADNLKPIVETTVPWDVVEPRYETKHNYRFGRSTWSWIVWQDASMNWDDQVTFIDLAAEMGYEYILIDAGWDKQIGYKRMEDLVRYAQSKKVDVFLWYSSSGYWNDIEQSPVNKMDNSIIRKKEMAWLQKLGVKGIKVDFFGGDKQETMRLYEQILSDADDHGLMVIFHGCTLPRGWERMYPNYVGSEAVLASENLIFGQRFCDDEAFNATLHPFIRNTVGCMEFGGCFLNHRLNRGNNGGTIRRTSDVFQLATTILFQNPIQNIGITPNNLTDAPKFCIDFLRQVPTTWDETRFIDGYPGKYVVLARRHGDRWYVAAINATKEPLKLKVELPMLAGKKVSFYQDDKKKPLQEVKVKKNGQVQFTLQTNGGAMWVETASAE